MSASVVQDISFDAVEVPGIGCLNILSKIAVRAYTTGLDWWLSSSIAEIYDEASGEYVAMEMTPPLETKIKDFVTAEYHDECVKALEAIGYDMEEFFQ